MFSVRCPRHGRRVLLDAGSIDAVVNTADGVLVHWHCWCGARGVLPNRRPARRRLDDEGLTPPAA
jgi:hypothetical protein